MDEPTGLGEPETMCDGCMCSWCVESRRKAHEYDSWRAACDGATRRAIAAEAKLRAAEALVEAIRAAGESWPELRFFQMPEEK